MIIKQPKAALEILNENNPERIVTLGGDCEVLYHFAGWQQNILMM